MCACNIRMLVLSIFILSLSEITSCYAFLQQRIHIIGNFFGFDKSRFIFRDVQLDLFVVAAWLVQ